MQDALIIDGQLHELARFKDLKRGDRFYFQSEVLSHKRRLLVKASRLAASDPSVKKTVARSNWMYVDLSRGVFRPVFAANEPTAEDRRLHRQALERLKKRRWRSQQSGQSTETAPRRSGRQSTLSQGTPAQIVERYIQATLAVSVPQHLENAKLVEQHSAQESRVRELAALVIKQVLQTDLLNLDDPLWFAEHEAAKVAAAGFAFELLQILEKHGTKNLPTRFRTVGEALAATNAAFRALIARFDRQLKVEREARRLTDAQWGSVDTWLTRHGLTAGTPLERVQQACGMSVTSLRATADTTYDDLLRACRERLVTVLAHRVAEKAASTQLVHSRADALEEELESVREDLRLAEEQLAARQSTAAARHVDEHLPIPGHHSSPRSECLLCHEHAPLRAGPVADVPPEPDEQAQHDEVMRASRQTRLSFDSAGLAGQVREACVRAGIPHVVQTVSGVDDDGVFRPGFRGYVDEMVPSAAGADAVTSPKAATSPLKRLVYTGLRHDLLAGVFVRNYAVDVANLVMRMAMRGYEVSEEDVALAWARYSDECDSIWVSPAHHTDPTQTLLLRLDDA